MTMPASGTIRMSQINTELGRSSTATISLDTAENGGYATINTNSASRPSSSNPASLSEWYSYNHSAAPATSVSFSSWYSRSYYTGGQSTSGTITVTGGNVTFQVNMAKLSSGTAFSSTYINGTALNVTPTNAYQTYYSSTLVLGPGTYSYSINIGSYGIPYNYAITATY